MKSKTQLFSLSYKQGTFSKAGTAFIILVLHAHGYKFPHKQLFVTNNGQDYYIIDKCIDSLILVVEKALGEEFSSFINQVKFGEAVIIGSEGSYILSEPAQMPKFASMLSNLVSKALKPEQIFNIPPPTKLLTPSGIENLKDVTIDELALPEQEIRYYSMYKDHQNGIGDTLGEIIGRIADGQNKYIFCTDGKHSNLISSYHIKGSQYFFIIDSMGYSSAERVRVVVDKNGHKYEDRVNDKLVKHQIKVLRKLEKKLVLGLESRQKDGVTCNAFVREDLRVLYHYPKLHEEIFKQSVLKKSDSLFVFTKFPAQMLLLYQQKLEYDDLRKYDIVWDRDGLPKTLELVLSEHTAENGWNMYPQQLIDSFLSGIKAHIARGTLLDSDTEKMLSSFLRIHSTGKSDGMIIPGGFEDVPGDGLCFYHSIALQLNNGATGRSLQHLTINEVLRNFQAYQNFIDGSPDNFLSYHIGSQQGKGGGWADHIMIQAMANALNRPITIQLFDLHGNTNGDPITILPVTNSDTIGSPLFIGNIANLHFVSNALRVQLNEYLPSSGSSSTTYNLITDYLYEPVPINDTLAQCTPFEAASAIASLIACYLGFSILSYE